MTTQFGIHATISADDARRVIWYNRDKPIYLNIFKTIHLLSVNNIISEHSDSDDNRPICVQRTPRTKVAHKLSSSMEERGMKARPEWSLWNESFVLDIYWPCIQQVFVQQTFDCSWKFSIFCRHSSRVTFEFFRWFQVFKCLTIGYQFKARLKSCNHALNINFMPDNSSTDENKAIRKD